MLRSARQLLSSLSRPVKLREAALRRLKEISSAKSSPQALKLKIESGGCSGFQYMIDLVPKASATSDDHVFDQDGCTIIVDTQSTALMSSCEVDYVQDMVRSSFQVVKNEVASAKCGCGTSFNIGF